MTTTPRPWLECRFCGELNHPDSTVCGVCGTTLDRSGLSAAPPPPVHTSGALAVLIAALAVVLLGVFLIAPGLGILLAIASVVPLVRTAVVIQKRAERGADVSKVDAAALFIASLGVTTLIVCVVTVAAVATFCFVCLAGASAGGGGGAFVLAGVATLIAVLAVVYSFSKWIRARWRRDIDGR